MISFFTNRKRSKLIDKNLYEVLNSAARASCCFGEGKVEDSPDGRFELVALFCSSIFCAMANRGPEYRDHSQRLFDAVFKAFDQALRELGVGDMSVAKRIRKLSESFYGRQKSYMDHIYQNDVAGLAKKIALNVFDNKPPMSKIEQALAKRAIGIFAKLKNLSSQELGDLHDLS